MLEQGRKAGRISQPHLAIAATAHTIVSRDTTEVAKATVAMFNPWRGDRHM